MICCISCDLARKPAFVEVPKSDIVLALGAAHRAVRGNVWGDVPDSQRASSCHICEKSFHGTPGVQREGSTLRRGGDGTGTKCRFCLLAMRSIFHTRTMHILNIGDNKAKVLVESEKRRQDWLVGTQPKAGRPAKR